MDVHTFHASTSNRYSPLWLHHEGGHSLSFIVPSRLHTRRRNADSHSDCSSHIMTHVLSLVNSSEDITSRCLKQNSTFILPLLLLPNTMPVQHQCDQRHGQVLDWPFDFCRILLGILSFSWLSTVIVNLWCWRSVNKNGLLINLLKPKSRKSPNHILKWKLFRQEKLWYMKGIEKRSLADMTTGKGNFPTDIYRDWSETNLLSQILAKSNRQMRKDIIRHPKHTRVQAWSTRTTVQDDWWYKICDRLYQKTSLVDLQSTGDR